MKPFNGNVSRGVSIYLARSTEIRLAYGPKDDQAEIAPPHERTLTGFIFSD